VIHQLKTSGDMSNLFWLTEAQVARLEPYFPKSHGKPRADDRRVLSGIIFINRNGLRWRDAPREYGPHKTLYNRWKRWSDKGIFAQMMAGLAADHGEQKTVMIDATYLKAHRHEAERLVEPMSVEASVVRGELNQATAALPAFFDCPIDHCLPQL